MTDIIIYGRGKTGSALQNMAGRLGFGWQMFDDENGFDGDGRFEKGSLVVVSPGVKPFAKGVENARNAGAEICSELDFCFPYCKGRCVSVTGTNGKTTTCELIFHILKCARKECRLLGNGGVPFSSQVLDVAKNETVVLESSSFQLDGAKVFSPYISVVTNVAPDHLDYHGNFPQYLNSKKNNFCFQQPNAYSVFNADDAQALELAMESPAYTLFYSTKNPHANCYFENGVVHLNIGEQQINYSCAYLLDLPKHNISNVLCAVTVCHLLGVPIGFACESIKTYKFLPHRLQTVAHFNGVAFVDDSKATNVHATISALECYENTPLALILGGSDKGCAFDEIFEKIKSNVKLICAVGETAERIYLTGKKHLVEVKVCQTYKQALYACYRKIKNIGGVVLMSNACASFDMFNGYGQRGDYFAQLVEELCRDEKKT